MKQTRDEAIVLVLGTIPRCFFLLFVIGGEELILDARRHSLCYVKGFDVVAENTVRAQLF